ncbi:hypothetical protein [Spirosoma validum]|uniref:DUF4468 domain-containing protein n=1 Tax=Spirosoma validum TaxID=2771355 RepID=A0A927B328_9BACT|nr:hypothetical protein [Spirosoma validum]MBD2754469.1 hypothetical protein [Spirosoma validum]
MNTLNIAIITVLLTSTIANAQMNVANYSYGKPGTDTYEHLSFWVKDAKRQDITYAYGKDRKEVKLRYAGKAQVNNTSGFNAQFPNNTILTIMPSGTTLKVSNPKDNYSKTFTWEYEGPVNGIGTFCDVCTQDEKEALKLVQKYYLK